MVDEQTGSVQVVKKKDLEAGAYDEAGKLLFEYV